MARRTRRPGAGGRRQDALPPPADPVCLPFVADPPPPLIPALPLDLRSVPPPPPPAPPAEPPGLACRDCGCRDLRVLATRPLPGGRIRRVRACRHCGRRLLTTEQAAGDRSQEAGDGGPARH